MDSAGEAKLDGRAPVPRIGKSGDWAEVCEGNVVRLTKQETAFRSLNGTKDSSLVGPRLLPHFIIDHHLLVTVRSVQSALFDSKL